MKRKFLVALLITTTIFVNPTSAYWEEHDVHGKYLFGYAGLDDNLSVYFPEVKSNFIPTNTHTLVVRAASDDVRGKLNYLKSHSQRAILILDDLLFRNDPALNTPCGSFSYRQRLDFKAKFDGWLNLNQGFITIGYVSVLVINSEVNNRCIASSALDEVTLYVKSKLPEIPTVAGYGSGGLSKALPDSIPSSLAGVAFFMYQVFNPASDAEYQAAYNLLKSKLAPEQRIILVPDGYYDSGHQSKGWAKWYLGYVAVNYMNLALNDSKVVGLIIFRWVGFEEFGEVKLGTRDLPQSVRDKHRQVGCTLQIESSPGAWC